MFAGKDRPLQLGQRDLFKDSLRFGEQNTVIFLGVENVIYDMYSFKSQSMKPSCVMCYTS